jgi:Flp pilus assembly protein TadG
MLDGSKMFDGLKKQFSSGRNNRRGMAVYVTALSLLFLIPMVGLAIDGGMAFVVKSRLGAALDSAALAAGRSVVLGSDVSGAQTAAQAAAVSFFNSNFPSGYLNTDTATRTVTASLTPQTNGTLQITVAGNVSVPTYFMRWLGVNTMNVAAVGTATRRNLVMMLVLDRSSSMGSRQTSVGTMPSSINYNTATSCEAMVYTAGQFINNFSPYDTIGLVSFDMTATLDYPPSTNFKASGTAGIAHAIANINCGGNTNTAGALNLATTQITTVGQKLALNHVVLFTDGVANGVNADFPIRTSQDTRLGPSASSPTPPSTPSGNVSNCADTSGTKACNMPACTTKAGTIRGVLAQGAGFAVAGGSRGLYQTFSTDPTPANVSGCPTSDPQRANQVIAYIPNTDRFGNSTSGPYDNVLEQVNQHCAPSGAPITPGNSACKNLTAPWSSYPTTGYGAPSNKYTAGPYSGYFRNDTPNAVGITSLNTAVNQASATRATVGYNITIDTIYLQGNGGDPVAPNFLQIVSNQPNFQSSIYEASTYPFTPTITTNPYFQSSQATGVYVATASTQQLSNAFALIASSLLRISQ